MAETRDRQQIARDAAAKLRAADVASHRALLGFDGFIDTIIHVVDTRASMAPEDFTPINTIEGFAARCAAAAGKSANIEMHITEDRFGGNGPLMAGAVGQLGMPTTYIGGVGKPDRDDELHPIFQPFADRCDEVICVGPPAFTDALEFDDGKLMLGKPANMQRITWGFLKQRLGENELLRRVEGADLLGVVNWTLSGGVQSIFEGLRDELLPKIENPPVIYVDLSDPAKRTDEDVAMVVRTLSQLAEHAPVLLGLNHAESERIDAVIGSGSYAANASEPKPVAIERAAVAIREKLKLKGVIIHPRDGAAAAIEGMGSAWFDGPFTRSPKLSTGAGDHFNGGFAFAYTLGLDLAESLAAGCAVSGCYVRDAMSPTFERLTGFLDDMPLPETD